MEKIKIYCSRDEHGSITGLNSSYLVGDIEGTEVVCEIEETDQFYELAKTAINQEYVLKKYGQYLLDEKLRPNYYENFKMWTEEEKEQLYPIVDNENQPSELEDLKERQLILENALQDIILMTMKGGE